MLHANHNNAKLGRTDEIMSNNELRDEFLSFLSAGMDSTSHLVMMVFYYLD